MLSRPAIPLLVFALALPVAVEVPGARDSSTTTVVVSPTGVARAAQTRLTLAGGGGTYGLVTRGCENQVIDWTEVRYGAAGGELSHSFRGPVTIGMRGGTIHEELRPNQPQTPAEIVTTRDHSYLNPFVRLDSYAIGASAGPMFIDEEFLTSGGEAFAPRFSASLRLGPERASIRLAWMEGVPLIADGGFFTAGADFRRWRRFELFIGMNAGGPGDAGGVIARGRWWLVPAASLNLSSHIGSATPVNEYGIAVGLTLRTPPPSP